MKKTIDITKVWLSYFAAIGIGLHLCGYPIPEDDLITMWGIVLLSAITKRNNNNEQETNLHRL